MAKRKAHRFRKGKRPPLPGQGQAQAGQPSAGGAEPRSDRAESGSWFRTRWPVIRFVLLFGLFMGAFHLLFFAPFTKGTTYKSYLNANAAAAGAVLDVLGFDVDVAGDRISSATRSFSITVRRGCDAIQPMALFVSALVAFPASIRSKVPAIFLGLAALATLNLARIVTLYIIGLKWPKLFHLMHVDVWQAVFIFLALLLWICWAWWATRDRTAADHAAT